MNNDLISREALKKAIEKAFEEANLSEYEACVCVCEIYDKQIDNAPTVEPEKIAIANVSFDENKLKEIVQTEVIDKIKSGELVLKDEKPQGERAERALAIIDRLRTDGHINNKEQGTLRRAILLPERPQGKCETCNYHNFTQAIINGIVELMSKNGITTIEELLETLKGGAE